MALPVTGDCLPDTRIREGERFLIESRSLESTFVSKLRNNNLLRAGIRGNTDFIQLEFSVVRIDRADMTQGPLDCIYKDTLYLFQVHHQGHQIGHLRVENGFLEVVPELERLTPLYFHQSSTGGLRIGQHTLDGPLVVATVEPGTPLSFEAPKSGIDRQVFNLVPIWRDINKKSESKLMLRIFFLPFVRFRFLYICFMFLKLTPSISFDNNNNTNHEY